ncbi:hypothetical protein WA171_002277, partial [Blastocystis sp. BT1]
MNNLVSELVNANWTEVWSTLKTESIQTLKQFYNTVDWSEPWIRCVLVGLIIWFVLIVYFRDNYFFQLTVFLVDSAVVFGAKGLNSIGRKYWQSFSAKNYFDEDGFFISFFVSLPILFITCFQIFFLLISIIKVNIEIRQWKELERKHEELKGKQQELEKVKEMISELEKDTDSELRKRHTEKS